jgi:hypothetical protein
MYDCTHSNISAVKAVFKSGDLVAAYVTGSSDIRWTSADLALFPHQSVITIDQGFTGSPVPGAMVRDVERGAWTPQNAVQGAWTPPRPTIYCNQSDLRTVLGLGWHGDVWLAEPGPMPVSAPNIPGVRVVAQQFGFESEYDISMVFDSNWPNLPPEMDVLSATGHAGYANFGWTFHTDVVKSELVIKGAGGRGTGTSYKDEFIMGTLFHAHVELAPGWYIARVRGYTTNSAANPWSSWRKFLVTKP